MDMPSTNIGSLPKLCSILGLSCDHRQQNPSILYVVEEKKETNICKEKPFSVTFVSSILTSTTGNYRSHLQEISMYPLFLAPKLLNCINILILNICLKIDGNHNSSVDFSQENGRSLFKMKKSYFFYS